MESVDLVTGWLLQCSRSEESDVGTGQWHPGGVEGEGDKGRLRTHRGAIETCRA